jgi:hypothetical protein
MGHAGNSMDDLYDKIREDVQFRQQWAERAGLGYNFLSLLYPLYPEFRVLKLL